MPRRQVCLKSRGHVQGQIFATRPADVLDDSQVIDLDHQGSLTNTSKVTGRHTPISLKEANGKYLIYDTPPYLSEELPGILEEADVIIIPTRIGYFELVGLKGIVDRVRQAKAEKKTYIVFNAVPARATKSLLEARSYFMNNYKDLNKAKTELRSYDGFTTIAKRAVFAHAKNQIKELIAELKI